MKKNFLFCIVVVGLLAYGCAVLGPRANYRKIGENRYSIKASDALSGITPSLYGEWERKAGEACGGNFTVIDREVIGNPPGSQHLIGVVECKSSNKKVVSDSVTKNRIYDVQDKLKKNGYDPGSVDGIFGEKTARALVEFQRDNNIPITGEVDEATLQALGL